MTIDGGVKVHDLHHRMHASIGAASAMGTNGDLGEFLQGFFEVVLHRFARELALPALIGLARITQAQSNAVAHHSCSEQTLLLVTLSHV